MFHQELLNSLGIRATVRSHNRASVTELRMILVGDLEAMREREHLKFAPSASLAGDGGWSIRMSREEGWGRIFV